MDPLDIDPEEKEPLEAIAELRAHLNEALEEIERDETRYHIRASLQHLYVLEELLANDD